jgi:7-cyano-7-deazaguanine reductase
MTRTHLGQTSALPASPEAAVLDYVPNPRSGALYLVALCRAGIHLALPGDRPARFRASGDRLCARRNDRRIKVAQAVPRQLSATMRRFTRTCTVGIGQRLFAEMKPHWLRIGGYWYPRGGIPIDVFWQSGHRPKACGCPIRACQLSRARLGALTTAPPGSCPGGRGIRPLGYQLGQPVPFCQFAPDLPVERQILHRAVPVPVCAIFILRLVVAVDGIVLRCRPPGLLCRRATRSSPESK